MKTEEIQTKGMVLAVFPQGEYGRRLSVLTDRFGKVTVFAQGAAKPGSRLVGFCRPMTCAFFLLARGKNAWNLHGASLIADFSGLFSDFDSTCYGSYVLEVLSYFSQEGMEEREAKQLLNLGFLTLSALSFRPAASDPNEETHRESSDRESRRKLFCALFELRILVIEGEYEELPQSGDESVRSLWHYAVTCRLSDLFQGPIEISEQMIPVFSKEVEKNFRQAAPHRFHSLLLLSEKD